MRNSSSIANALILVAFGLLAHAAISLYIFNEGQKQSASPPSMATISVPPQMAPELPHLIGLELQSRVMPGPSNLQKGPMRGRCTFAYPAVDNQGKRFIAVTEETCDVQVLD